MSLSPVNGARAIRKGPIPKGGGERERLQVKMPTQLASELVKVASESSFVMTDLGGYLLIRGWNELRKEQGLPPIPMPAYLEKCGNTDVSAAEPLFRHEEESRLAG